VTNASLAGGCLIKARARLKILPSEAAINAQPGEDRLARFAVVRSRRALPLTDGYQFDADLLEPAAKLKNLISCGD
jgi:hypothetical protein